MIYAIGFLLFAFVVILGLIARDSRIRSEVADLDTQWYEIISKVEQDENRD